MKPLAKFVLGFGCDAWPNEGGAPTVCRWVKRAFKGSHYQALIGNRWRYVNAVGFRD